ncbi:unnamed protein product [Lupinus luteus]|uniref:Uncharacterized protein n=1 Tax=Lupinus luteus TaxID=3873 RepID=A0AAV1YEU0_LUPLU
MEVHIKVMIDIMTIIIIAVILMVLITRFAKATLDNEESEHANEMLPLVESKELNLPKLVTIRIDPLKEDLEQKLMVTV